MRRLFKNCPNKKREQCLDCVMLNHCLAKKVKRKIRRIRRGEKVTIVKTILVLMIFLIFSVTLVGYRNKQYSVRMMRPIETARTEVIEVEPVRDQDKDIETKVVAKVVTNKESKKNTKKVKNVTKAKISSNGPSEDYYYNISDYDKKIIEKLVYKEARGESIEGKTAVAAVVLNRYVSKENYFNTTSIESIAMQNSQFADISEVSQEMLATYPDCKKAVDMALRGWDPTRKMFSNGAKYFFEPNKIGKQEKAKREGITILKIGNHCFHNDFNE